MRSEGVAADAPDVDEAVPVVVDLEEAGSAVVGWTHWWRIGGERRDAVPSGAQGAGSVGLGWRYWWRRGRERWDVVLALAAVLVGVVIIIGWAKVLGTSLCLALGVGLAEMWQRWRHVGSYNPQNLDHAENEQRRLPPLPPLLPQPSATSAPSAQDISPRQSALESLKSLLLSCTSLDSSITTSLTLLSGVRRLPARTKQLQSALHQLCTEMTDNIASASSSLSGLVDHTELKTLGEMYDIPSEGRKARPRISDRTDSSGLAEDIGIASERFGGLMGEKYRDIGLGLGAVPSPRRQPPVPLQLDSSTTIRPLRTQYLSAHTSSYPMSTTRSLPSGANSRHNRHHSLLPSLPSTAASDQTDHFTSLPRRSGRRLSKRASWDVGHETRGGEAGLLQAWRPGEISTPSKRPVHERRITEADEEGDLSWSSASGQEDGPTDSSNTSADEASLLVDRPLPSGLRALNLPSSPTLSSPRQAHTPKHASPLTGRRRTGDTDPLTPIRSGMSLTESAVRLAALSYPSSPPAFSLLRQSHTRLSLNVSPPTVNPKRRSLGTMPYNHDLPSSPTLPYLSGSQGLSRTRSLQSDLQAARERSATGSRSRPTSMTLSVSSSVRSGMSTSQLSPASPSFPLDSSTNFVPLPSPHRPHRIPSVSPLTTPALQAACLGMHLKRRRVACSLLALRWTEEADGYWQDVREALEQLREGIERETLKLGAILAGQADPGLEAEERYQRLTPPWSGGLPFAPSVQKQNGDFAPTTSDKEKMEGHVVIIQKALERAWEEAAMLRRQLAGDQSGSAEELDLGPSARNWAGLREELGIMVREVERGRETLASLSEGARQPLQESAETVDTSGNAPTFLRTWDDTDALPPRSVSVGTTANTDLASPERQHDGDDAPEVLAPAGLDEIYEADLSIPERPDDLGLGKMGRAERVGMMKLARAEGLTLGEYMRRNMGRGEDVVVKKREEGGQKVVDELKGVLGLVRMKKGLPGGVDSEGRASIAGLDVNSSSTGTALGPEEANEVTLPAAVHASGQSTSPLPFNEPITPLPFSRFLSHRSVDIATSVPNSTLGTADAIGLSALSSHPQSRQSMQSELMRVFGGSGAGGRNEE